MKSVNVHVDGCQARCVYVCMCVYVCAEHGDEYFIHILCDRERGLKYCVCV